MGKTRTNVMTRCVTGMRTTRKVLKQGVKPAILTAAMLAVTALLVPSAAHAQAAYGPALGMEGYAASVSYNTNVLVDIFSYVAFISGIILGALGVQELRKHIEGAQIPLRTPLAKFGIGGLLLALPFITEIVAETMGYYDFSPFEIIGINKFTFPDAGVTGGIGSIIANGINNTGVLVNVAAFAAFIIGVFFTLRGIQMMRAHIENPGNAPLPESIKRLAVGGALLSFPVIVNIVYETFGAYGNAMGNTGWSTGNAASGGLDGMMVRFIGDIASTSYFGIEMFCYIAGILMVLFAMQRLVKTAQDGPRGPLGFGTIVMFIVAGLLLSFPQLLSSLDTSLFLGNGKAKTAAVLALTDVDPTQRQNAESVFSAVLAFMAVIGFLSVVRGLFILKAFADGNNQATVMSVATHIVAGALAINLGSLINAIKISLGVTNFGVTFS